MTAMAADPFAVAQRYATAPYARGAASQALALGPAAAGLSPVLPYDFFTVQARYGLQSQDVTATFILTLLADQLAGPAVVEIAYAGTGGAGTVGLIVPAGSLAGTSVAVAPLPNDPALVLQSLREHPVPAAGEPSGPAKWSLTALLGHGARLLWTLSGEAAAIAATARDVDAQHHLATARGGSLDRIGQGLGVPRLLPSPYRLDYDADTVALYHLDEATAPVLDATHEHPGMAGGATRGVPGRFGQGCQITSSGGIVVPDAIALAIDPSAGFTVELFASLAAAPAAQETVLFAAKRPRFGQADSPGWALALEPSAAGHDLAFTLTDRAGTVVRAAGTNVVPPAGWFHVAGVVDPASGQASVLLNGIVSGTAPLGSLGIVDTGADLGLGADATGAPHLVGSIDEVRLSAIARSDFATVLGASPAPYTTDAQTIALYHLDETDAWIDEDSGTHFAINRGALRGLPARFGGGLAFRGDLLPHPHCAAERDFQTRLSTGAWDRSAGGAPVTAGPYARFGYRQGAISEPGLDGAPHPVMVNDQSATAVQGLVTTACAGFIPTDPTDSADPAQTIAAFQAAGRSAQEAIDYFGEWYGLPASFFAAQYLAHGLTATYEPCLPASPGPTSAFIPGAADFAFGTESFTVEAFIDADPMTGNYARAAIASRSSALRVGDTATSEAGWALCLGPYRAIPDNLRWILGDAAGTLVTVDANVSLADGLFHHVAGVVDREVGVARLVVDGAEVGQASLAGLGAVATAGPITLGNAPALNAPFAGMIDEVRLSRGARRSFAPVLGESDARYRQRLAIFQPWRLPNAPTIRRCVQALTLGGATPADVTGLLLGAGDPPADRVQFDVDDSDDTRSCASRWLRIVPDALAPGQSLAADGTSPAIEPGTAGRRPLPATAAALLSVPDGANYTFGATSSRSMVLATARMLERLAARLAVVSPASRMRIDSAYLAAATAAGGTAAPSNDSLGLALTVRLDGSPGFGLDRLGAMAFERGAAFVAHQAPQSGAPVLRLVAQAGDDLDVQVTGFGAGATDPGTDRAGRQIVILDEPVTVSITRPVPPPAGGLAPRFDWSLLPAGPAAGRLSPSGSGVTASLAGTALGVATLAVRCTLPDGVTVLAGSLPIIIAPRTLEGCDALGGDGTPNATELAASGSPDADFRTAFLLPGPGAVVDYAPTTPPASPLMQLALETALLALAARVAREPGAPRLTVLAAYDPTATTLQSVGRGLVVAPSSAALSAGRLGALAYLAGFSYVERRRYPASVYLSVPPGDRFAITAGPLRRLWANARISGRGAFMATEFAAAGPPDPGFDPAALQPFTDPRATFAAGVSNQVQQGLATALTSLLAALAADGIAGTMQVVAGFRAGDPSLLGVGRAVLARHPAVGADRLAGYALQAGFAFVHHRTADPGGPAVYIAAYPAAGPPPDLRSNADPDAPYVEVTLDALTALSVRPRLAVKGRLAWSAQAACPAAATLSTALPDPSDEPGLTDAVFCGTGLGAAAVVATFSLSGPSTPYQFVVAPGPQAEGGTAPKLSKDQYDDLLNFLDAYHPIGAAAVTRSLRAFVHGFKRPPRWDRLPTEATFPRYRTP